MALRFVGEGNSTRNSASATQPRRFILFLLVALVSAVTASSAREMRTATRPEHWHFTLGSGLAVSANLPAGTVGASYSGKISATGGATPYSFSVVDGSLPSGLSLNSTTGYVTGTPTVAANKYAWVRVTDTKELSSKLRIHVVINPGDGSSVRISITPTSASVASGGFQQFLANVQDASNTAVTWSASAGTISSTGYLTAPKVTTATTVTVRATR